MGLDNFQCMIRDKLGAVGQIADNLISGMPHANLWTEAYAFDNNGNITEENVQRDARLEADDNVQYALVSVSPGGYHTVAQVPEDAEMHEAIQVMSEQDCQTHGLGQIREFYNSDQMADALAKANELNTAVNERAAEASATAPNPSGMITVVPGRAF